MPLRHRSRCPWRGWGGGTTLGATRRDRAKNESEREPERESFGCGERRSLRVAPCTNGATMRPEPLPGRLVMSRPDHQLLKEWALGLAESLNVVAKPRGQGLLQVGVFACGGGVTAQVVSGQDELLPSWADPFRHVHVMRPAPIRRCLSEEHLAGQPCFVGGHVRVAKPGQARDADGPR